MSRPQKVSALIVFMSIFIINNAYAACTGSGLTWTCTANSTAAQVQTCLNSASVGATITFEAGTGTWNSHVSIRKAVTIIGAGQGNTIINTTYSGGGGLEPSAHLISIEPASPETNPVIRLSGFTFNFGTGTSGILYRNDSTTYDCTNVRLDHLTISSAQYVFQRYGLAHGVMDNCVIRGQLDGGGSGTLWTTNGYEHGTVSNFYIEDSTWASYTNSSEMKHDGNGAYRYSWRYNTITLPSSFGGSLFLYDMHGNQYGAQASGFGAELYGNLITGTRSFLYFDQRGGKSLVYNNKFVTGAVSTRVQEEHQDTDGAGSALNCVNGQPQHISSTYYWSNWANGSILNPSIDDSLTVSTPTTCGWTDPRSGFVVPTVNKDFWTYTESFNGTSGVGCGTLASRPATCTTGVGYWATNQSCSDMTGMVGANPSTPISGTLYKCTATNTWTSYYTPYTYPHPLRGGATSAPVPPKGFGVGPATPPD